MKFILEPSFKEDFKRLTPQLKRRTEKSLQLLANNPCYHSLHFKKMQGTKDIWEVRVSKGYRITLQLTGTSYRLRHVGSHDRLRRP